MLRAVDEYMVGNAHIFLGLRLGNKFLSFEGTIQKSEENIQTVP